MKYFTLYITSLFIFLCSCTKEDNDFGSEESKTVYVTFTVQVPVQAIPSTRSISVADENYLQSIDVLVFKQSTDGNEYFAYKVEAEALDNNDVTSKKFSVLLDRSNDPHRLVFIANARTQVNTLDLADTTQIKEQMLSELSVENTSRWNATSSTNFSALPMWGQTDLYPIISATNNISEIKLLRMLARVDLQVNANVNFDLFEVYIYNRNSVGRIVPDALSLDVQNMVVTQPSLPGTPNTMPTPLHYVTVTGIFNREIYLFETAATEISSQVTSLVIGGSYNGEPVTYYRVDFLDSDNLTHLDILRNHLYSMTITAVSGNGYSTINEAFTSPAQNMESEIFVWDQGGLNDIYFNNEYLLGLSSNEFTFESVAYDSNSISNKLIIGTNYPNGWSLESITDESGLPTTGWITLDSLESSGPFNNTVSILLKENTQSTPRTAYIHFRAGRLVHECTVTQAGIGIP